MATLQLQHLRKVFPGDIRAVDDLSLEVVSGELLAVIGPSGCGKTTMLRLIAGLETPSAGTVCIGDRDVTDLAPAARNVAMAFQDHALYPHLDVYENLAFALRLRGAKAAAFDADVRQMAERLQIDCLLHRQVHELSEGQRQRVALGRALVRQPDCFLLDEPLGSLDETLRGQLREEIRRLHRELTTTMIFVTHDQHEAMMLGDRIAVLDEGRLQQCGTPEQVYRHPVNRRVATLIGTPTMNFLSGTIDRSNDAYHFDAGQWKMPLSATHTGELDCRLSEADNREVLLGVRPQAVSMISASATEAADRASVCSARVERVRPLGDVLQLQLALPGERSLIAIVASNMDVREGANCTIQFDSQGVHLFEAVGDGANLLRDGAAVGGV